MIPLTTCVGGISDKKKTPNIFPIKACVHLLGSLLFSLMLREIK